MTPGPSGPVRRTTVDRPPRGRVAAISAAPRSGARAYDRCMVLASTASDVVTAVCMVVVLGMSGLLVVRATRSRPEDVDDEQE